MSDTAELIKREVVKDLVASGVSSEFKIHLPGPDGGTPSSPIPGIGSEILGICVPIDSRQFIRSGGSLAVGERAFNVFDLSQDPEAGQRASFYGESENWLVVSVEPYEFGGAPIGFVVKLKRNERQ